MDGKFKLTQFSFENQFNFLETQELSHIHPDNSTHNIKNINEDESEKLSLENFKNLYLKTNFSNISSDFLLELINHNPRDYKQAKYAVNKPINKLLLSYAANSYKGLIRNYNEDFLTVISNLKSSDSDWPMVSYYGIFDGHGGKDCALFLKKYLHRFVR
jgi:hypothetical protein